MNTYVVLLRGINVGGKNLVPMKDLRASLEEAGFESVSTYIQSGNIVLKYGKSPEKEIETLIQTTFGFSVEVMVLYEEAFCSSVSNNPFQDQEGKEVHFYFCKERPKINNIKLEEIASQTEQYELIDSVFYLSAPDGIGRSKLVANIEACLGVTATGRNLNTVRKLIEMVENA